MLVEVVKGRRRREMKFGVLAIKRLRKLRMTKRKVRGERGSLNDLKTKRERRSICRWSFIVQLLEYFGSRSTSTTAAAE